MKKRNSCCFVVLRKIERLRQSDSYENWSLEFGVWILDFGFSIPMSHKYRKRKYVHAETYDVKCAKIKFQSEPDNWVLHFSQTSHRFGVDVYSYHLWRFKTAQNYDIFPKLHALNIGRILASWTTFLSHVETTYPKSTSVCKHELITVISVIFMVENSNNPSFFLMCSSVAFQ